MNVNFESYRIFYYVASNLNITKAAMELHISQPGVSKSLKNLEDQLGCKLCLRSKKGITLTEEGKIFYNELKNGMESIYSAEHKLKEMLNFETGLIKIGISNTLTQNYLLNYIKGFNTKYPNIKIQIHTEPTFELIKKARAHILDFIILNLPYDVPEDFAIKKLKKIDDILVGSSTYRVPECVKLEEINNYPLILLAKNSNTRTFLNDYFAKSKVTLEPEMELASYQLVTKFIEKGLGIGFLTKDFIEQELKNNILKEIPTDFKLPSRYIGLIYLKEKGLSTAAQKFIELLSK